MEYGQHGQRRLRDFLYPRKILERLPRASFSRRRRRWAQQLCQPDLRLFGMRLRLPQTLMASGHGSAHRRRSRRSRRFAFRLQCQRPLHRLHAPGSSQLPERQRRYHQQLRQRHRQRPEPEFRLRRYFRLDSPDGRNHSIAESVLEWDFHHGARPHQSHALFALRYFAFGVSRHAGG